MPKPKDDLLHLHRRLLDGDRTASEEVARCTLAVVFERVSRSYPRTDEQLVMDGVVDAVLEYCERAVDVEVESGVHLLNHLARAAWRNVANAMRGEKRRRAREERYGARAIREAVEQITPAGILEQKEDAAERRRRVAHLMALFPDEKDREVLRLKLAGERRTVEFARILGIDHLPVAEQREIVKRTKDRIEKVIRRTGLGR